MKSSTGYPAVLERFVKPAVPIVLVLLLLFAFKQDANAAPLAGIVVLIICGTILWFGWSWARRNVVTKWIGILLVAYLAIILGLLVLVFAVGIVFNVGPLLALLFILALPFLAYDLFFRQPHKGRFARARAQRRNLPL